jgi:catechol 2,3-dioxygenase
MSTASAPLEIGSVALTVNDLAAVRSFYEAVLGLVVLSEEGGVARLGAGGPAFLELREDRAARRADPREAGLFHTAFLLPSREALGRWLLHAAQGGTRLQGASDHLVSEAIYLSDPEGNGIEVYADKPRAVWPQVDGKLRMATERLDLDALARTAQGPWRGAPEGTVVGHVHLQVGAVPEAEAFYSGTLGFPVTTHYPGAAFYGSGGYHHHLATNVWNSRGAGLRQRPSTGLAELRILADPSEFDATLARTGGQSEVDDPWGTRVTLARKPG